ncbi:MAG: SH3 domain-containing protein [Pyrinomonadaceae bacterium]
MKSLLPALILFALVFSAEAQRRPSAASPRPAPARPARTGTRSPEIGQQAVVVDETLSVLRESPSLFAPVIHRIGRGKKVQILAVAEGDGVKFYKVVAPPTSNGWVQADAVFGKFRKDDEKRLAELTQALDGYDQIEAATQFLELYPASQFRPAILLLYGDLLEELAVGKLSKEANSRLKRGEMAASGAPMHSYYLNFVSLDRYRKLGITFLFDPNERRYHYDGSSWREIVAKFPAASEAAEAKKRLDALTTKMSTTTAAGAK